MKKMLILLVILSILFLGGFLIRSRNAKAIASKVQTVEVKRTDFIKLVSSSGKTLADQSVDLKFQTSGKLAWVRVKEGDIVKAYQAIAGMDSREVKKNLEKALRDYSSERNDFEQQRQDQALTDTMRRILQKNQWDLEKSVLDVELKHLAFEYATLISPIAGIVTHIDTPVAGVNITPASAVFHIANPESIVFEANVDEMDIGDVSLGLEATMYLDAYPESSFSGVISFISYSSEQSSGGSTVFPVKISFRTPPDTIRIGLNGDVKIIVKRIDNVLTVPLAAIREENGSQYVYKKMKGAIENVAVETGLPSEDEIIILSGLDEGDAVVTKGFSSILK